MVYELWDVVTGNRVGQYSTVEEAYKDVKDAIERYGITSKEVLDMYLIESSSSGRQIHVLALGKGLADLVFHQ